MITKKAIALLLAFAMVFACFACAGTEGTPAEAPASSDSSSSWRTSAYESVNAYKAGDEANVKLADTQKIVFTAQESSGSYDPIRDEQLGEITLQMFEGLYTWENGEIVYGMASNVELAEDNVTYTITVRDDAYWSDGVQVTAKDFVDSWLRELDPATAAKYVDTFKSIVGAMEYNSGTGSREDVGIKLIDDMTMQVVLKAPAVAFEELLAMKGFAPVRMDIVEKYGENWAMSPESCVCNGPFMMKEYKPGEKIVLVKNPYYYGADTVTVEELEARFITDSSVELIAYQNHEIDIATHATAETMENYPADAWSQPKLTCMWLVVNTQREALSDARVRKALAMAIDRDALCESVVMGGVTPAFSIVPSTFVDYSTGKLFNDHEPNFPYDPEQARALLAEAGYPNGEGFPTITYGTSASTEYENVAQAVTAMWKQELGINCEIAVSDSTQFIANRKAGGYDVARYISAGAYSDPALFLNFYTSDNPNNDSKYFNPDYDALSEKALEAQTADEKFALYHEQDQFLADEMVVIPLYYPAFMYLFHDNVAGIGVSKAGVPLFKHAYVIGK